MDNDTYNGWTNRETWLVKLWIDNDQESHFYWRSQASDFLARDGKASARRPLECCLQRTIEEDAPELRHGMYADLLNLAISRVDWSEIAEAMLDDLDEPPASESQAESVLIFSYTRAQAVADGVLIDVSKLAKEAGFCYPVAMTEASWRCCVSVPEGVDCQDETGRLWDILNVLRFSIRGNQALGASSDIRFTVSVRNSDAGNEDIALKALCTPGDTAEPVITIMFPDED